MPDLPAWLEFVATLFGGSLIGALGAVLTYGRQVRKVEDRWGVTLQAYKDEQAARHTAVAERLMSVENKIGGNGDGINGRLERIEEELHDQSKTEHRHYNRITAALVIIGTAQQVDISDIFTAGEG